MKLTNGQQRAIDDCINWVLTPYDSKEKDFIISGFAGTGKSTIVNQIIKKLNMNVAVCGPTHKSLRVLKNMGSVKTFTVHSALGLKLNTNIENFDIRKPNFDPKNMPKFIDYKLMVFDESSMIPKQLHSFILKLSDKYNTKVIFMGDPLQLPPVGEFLSEALKYRDRRYVELTEIVRQEKGHPLLELLGIVRNDVINGTNRYLKYLKQNPNQLSNGIGYKVYNPVSFSQKIKDVYSDPEYNNNVNYVKYLAYTNDRIIEINKFIRHHIIKGADADIITTDDLTTAYQTVMENNLMSTILINSDDYVPVSIRPFVNVSGYKGYIVNLVNIYSKVNSSMFIIDHTDPSIKLYIKRLSMIHEMAKQDYSKWGDYYAFRNANISMVKFKLFNKFYPNGIAVDRDLDYAYGSTVHKAQGSTFDNGFIDIKNINKSFFQGIKYRNRLIYVALSRVQNQAFILI
jgi:exodeoxyribonuclease-5